MLGNNPATIICLHDQIYHPSWNVGIVFEIIYVLLIKHVIYHRLSKIAELEASIKFKGNNYEEWMRQLEKKQQFEINRKNANIINNFEGFIVESEKEGKIIEESQKSKTETHVIKFQ